MRRVTGDWADRLLSVLADRPADRIPETECETRAAVTLILRPSDERSADRRDYSFVDPKCRVTRGPAMWRCPGAAGNRMMRTFSIRPAARLSRKRVCGSNGRTTSGGWARFTHCSKRLPSVCVTPFVAWMAADQEVRVNHELTGHVWVPVSALSDPAYRSTLVREPPSPRECPGDRFRG